MSRLSERTWWTLVVFCTVAVSGAALQARGALMPNFQTAFDVSEGQLGLLTPVGTLGFVGPVVLLGLLAGRVDIRRAVVVGIAATAALLAALATAPTFLALLGLVFLRSAAVGIFRGLDRPMLSHLYPDARGRIFNLQAMSWAVGATLGPAVVTLAILWGDWRLTYLLLAAAMAPLALVAWRLELPADLKNERSFPLEELRPLLRRPAVSGMAVATVLVGGVESSFFTWLPYYATGFLPRSTANLSLSVLLAAYVPGRFAFSHLSERVSPPDVVLVVAVVLVGLVYAALSGADGPTFLVLVFLVGFLLSGLFPTLLTWGVEAAPTYTGPVNAVSMVSGQVGFFVVPAVIGLLAERYTIGVAMQVPVVLMAALVALLAVRRVVVADPH